MQSCPSRETLSDFTDGALPPFQHWSVQRHTRGCSTCAEALARERQWDTAARGYLASAAAPSGLRDTVLAALALQPAVAPPRLRRVATLATALSLAALGLIAALRRPTPQGVLPGLPPAYGEVAKSMGQIQTAQWTQTNMGFDLQTGKAKAARFVDHCSARMTPPALRIESTNPHSVSVFSPDHSWSGDELRRHILSRLLPPPRTMYGKLEGWRLQLVQQNGKSLWRYEWQMGDTQRIANEQQDAVEGFGFDIPRLTHDGLRFAIWVTPETRRVVHFEREIYMKRNHPLTILDNFVYDQPLPDALFRPTSLPAKK